MNLRNQFVYYSLRFLLILLFGVFILQSALSQTPTYHFYNSEKGLPSSEAYDCEQDADGNIWVVTDNGVAKFNSREFKNYTVEDGLPGSVIFKIFKDPNNTLWFAGFNKSMCYYDSKNDRFVPYKYNHILERIHEFVFINNLSFIDNSGGLGFEANTGYFEIDDDGTFSNKSNLNASVICNISATSTQIYRNSIPADNPHLQLSIDGILDTTIVFEKNKNYVQKGGPKCFRVSSTEYILFFNEFLIHVNGRNVRTKKFPESILDAAVWHEQLYLGLFSHGIHVLDLENLETKKVFFNGSTISSLLIDQENSLWATSTELGLIYRPNSYFEDFQFKPSENIITSAQFEERLFIVTKSKQLYEFEIPEEKYSHRTKKNKAITFSSKLFIENGRIPDSRVRPPFYAFDLQSNTFVQTEKHQKCVLINDSLSIFGFYNGLCTRNIQNYETVDTLLIGKYVSELFEYAPQKIIVSLKPGILHLDATNLENFKLDTIAPSLYATSFTKYGNGTIVTTKAHGVWMFENGTFRLLNKKLPKVKYSDCAVKGNRLLFSSSNGLYVYNTQTTNVKHYGKYHGLSQEDLLNVFNGEDGNVWLVSRSGIIRFNQDKRITPVRPSIQLTHVIADADTVLNNQFQHHSKVIEFQVLSMCYKCLGDVTYKYRLRGLSEEWITSKQPQIRFNNLQAGNYTLEIIAVTPGGERSRVCRYNFNIPLPFWETWWFYLLVTMLVLFSFYLIHATRKNNRLKEVRLTDQLNYHQQLALRKYMNPHFIFNSLNSIQNYVVTGEKEEAQTFITQFSKLMREYFDAGVNEEISIKTELDILDRYVEIEEKRLQKNIYFDYHVSPNIDIETTLIPSFILQPVIENSIWHGFGQSEEGGTITLSISEREGIVHVIIADNGLGMTDHAETSNKSNSTSVNTKRLQLLSKLHKEKFEFRRNNILDNAGKVLGFQVEISLPMYRKDTTNNKKGSKKIMDE
jgi:hypothetical protein